MNNTRRSAPGYALTVAWVVMAVIVVAGFIRVETVAHRVALESELRAWTNCQSLNSQRDAVLTMTRALREYARTQSELEGGESPSEELSRDEFVTDVENSIPEEDCPPSPFEQSTEE